MICNIRTRLSIANVQIKDGDNPKSHKCRNPVHKKHNGNTQNCAYQRHPWVVILKKMILKVTSLLTIFNHHIFIHRSAVYQVQQSTYFTLKDGLHPGDFVIEAWKTEKLIRAYAQTKKLDSRLETMSNWAEN